MSLLILTVALSSCSSSGGGDDGLPQQPDPAIPEGQGEIKISTSVTAITRATDTGFDTNDRIGLFVVNRGSNNASNELKTWGNHVDNMLFTYNGIWTPYTPVYWKDDNVHADFYMYFPYKSSVGDVSAMLFSVNADQSSESKYKESELLIGSTKDVAPTESNVNINASHSLSQMIVEVAAGNGFTNESLASADINVTINGVKTGALVNLATAIVSATGEIQSIKPWHSNGIYKALIVPQTVGETNLITVNVDGRDYNLKKGFTFQGGKSYKFTVTVGKTGDGINIDIIQWDTDGVDNGGVAE